jgi:mono/diheme cytochrome c family protein
MGMKIAAAVLSTLWLIEIAHTGAQTPSPRSSLAGVFTDAQAERGKTAYQDSCASCHGAALVARSDDAPSLTAPDFKDAWIGKSIGERYERVRSTMPQDGPGSLSNQAYVDIVAYILKFNGYPAGDQELKPDAATLQQIIIEPVP